jgi:hypothetical protein
MITKFIEASHGGRGNWGKFCVCRFEDHEWARESYVAKHDVEPELAMKTSLLRTRGWSPRHIIVLDLETGEGAAFSPGGSAQADLNKKQIFVCPLFEPFLNWLYQQDLSDIQKLPNFITLPNAPFSFSGYRRSGGNESQHGS